MLRFEASIVAMAWNHSAMEKREIKVQRTVDVTEIKMG